MSKMTNKLALTIALDALNLVADEIETKGEWTMDEVKAKISKLIAQYNERNPHKLSKNQQENDEIKEAILETLAKIGPSRATDVANVMGLSSGQKASSLLNALVKEGKVVKEKGEKNAVLFAVKGE